MTKDKTNIEEIIEVCVKFWSIYREAMIKNGQSYNVGLKNWKSQGFSYNGVVEIIEEKIKDQVQAKKAHRTEEDYCCACSYDMAVMQEKIDKKCEKYLDRYFEHLYGGDKRDTRFHEHRYKIMKKDLEQFKKEQRHE